MTPVQRRGEQQREWKVGRRKATFSDHWISLEPTSPSKLPFTPTLPGFWAHAKIGRQTLGAINKLRWLLEEMREVQRKLHIFKIREANKENCCSVGACLPHWLSEVAPQAWTCPDKSGSWWLILCPEDLPISHKLGLPVCLRKSHDSSWQLSVYYLKWEQGEMSNLVPEKKTKERMPLPVTLSRFGLEGLMWQGAAQRKLAVSAHFKVLSFKCQNWQR